MSDLVRRDPRVERIRRNRLHPLHAQYAAALEPLRGPSGLLRKNPHAVGFIGPNGIKRIDRSAGTYGGTGGQLTGARARADGAESAALPLHRVENPDFYVVVVPDLAASRLSSHDRDVFGQARRLVEATECQGAVVAVALGELRDVAFDTAGADRVIHLSEVHGQALNGYCPELKLAVLKAVEAKLKPSYWLFPDSIHGGADLGARLSALLGERPATHAWQVDVERSVCRGGSGLTDWSRPTPRVLLLAEECALPVNETRHEAAPIALKGIPQATPVIEDLGPVDVDPAQIALEEAEFILSGGNGVRDWDQFHMVAGALGASEGASRVAVDEGHMPRSRQVGATGTYVSARVYVAVGISGAIQHLQGIAHCDKVVCINLDENCDMVKRADLSIIGDSAGVLAELLQLAQARRDQTSAAEESRHVA